MDSLIEDVGGWGRFQWFMVGTIKYATMPIAWSMMQMAFAGLVPDWWCLADSPLNSSLSPTSPPSLSLTTHPVPPSSFPPIQTNSTYQVCEIPGSDGKSCDGHVVFDTSVRTVINEWSLICDQSNIKSLMTSLQMGGVMLGALIAGQASDSFGRRLTIYLTSLCHIITSLVAAFSVTWQMFIVMRVLIGVTLGVFLVAFFSYPMEFVSPKYRPVVAFLPGWSAGVSIFALTAWLAPNWSYLHIGSAVLGVPYLFTWFVIPESFRWLATKGRLDEAEAVLERVARINGRAKPQDVRKRLQQVTEEEKRTGQGRRYTYLDVYRGWRMAATTLVLNGIWFTLAFCYYGISFGVTGLSGNIYLNIFLMTLVEIPPNFSTIYLANRLGRRWTCLMFFVLCSLSSFGILVVSKTVSGDSQHTATVVLAMISKLSVAAAWLGITTFTSEQYPTVIRNLGYGASNTVSRVGGALAPVLLNMDTTEEVVRGYIVVGSLMAASGAACLLLRETKGQALQDSITVTVKDQAEDGKKDGPWVDKEDKEMPVWSVTGDKVKVEGIEHTHSAMSVRL